MEALAGPARATQLEADRRAAAAALISSLSDEQLALPTRPPRAREQVLADTIERVPIGHYDTHRRAIELKLGIQPPAT